MVISIIFKILPYSPVVSRIICRHYIFFSEISNNAFLSVLQIILLLYITSPYLYRFYT